MRVCRTLGAGGGLGGLAGAKEHSASSWFCLCVRSSSRAALRLRLASSWRCCLPS